MSKQNSIGLTKDNYDNLKKAAANRGTSMTAYLNSLIDQVGIADKDEKVILSIPMTLTRRNEEALRRWLLSRVEALVDAYYPKKVERKVNVDVAAN